MKEFFVIHFNCDCGAYTLLLSAQQWKPKIMGFHHCRSCHKKLGDMDYNILMVFKENNHLSANNVWVNHQKSLKSLKPAGA